MKKTRLDAALLDRGLASTRTKAQALIREGKVLVSGKECRQPGEKIDEGAEVILLAKEHPYVSRGGLKLESALQEFAVPVAGARALDVGQSTGGFTHCLLLRGAAEVVGIEVGHGQLAADLRQDSRVRTLERQDIRELDPSAIAPEFSLGVVDLSFISLTLVLPKLPPFFSRDADLILLVKPQFELAPDKIGSGGIVRRENFRREALLKVERAAQAAGFTVAGCRESPVEGGDGNVEYLLHLRRASSPAEF